MTTSFVNQANEFITEKKFEEAKILLKNGLEKEPENIEAEKLLGLCNVNLKNYQEAIHNFEKVVESRPDDATSWFYLGTMYDNTGNFERAENAYLKVISLREEYADAYKNLSVLYLKFKAVDKAEQFAKKASELDPMDYQSYYMLGTICVMKKDLKAAVENYEKAAGLNSSNIGILNSLGSAYFATNQMEKAASAFNNALILEEENPITHYNLGNIAQIKRNYAEAFRHFRIAYQHDPSTLNLTALAYSALKAEKFEDAVNLYKTLSVIHPEKQNFQYNLACAYIETKNYKEAIQLLKKLVVLNPKSSAMAQKLAQVYIELGEYEDAKTVYALLISKGKVSSDIYYNYALVCMKTGDVDTATKIFKKVIALEPENAFAHKDLAVIYLNQRLFDYANEEFQTALKLAPDHPLIVFEFANFLYSTADYQGAEKLYKKVTGLITDDARIFFYQGLNYLALNDIKNAKIAFENSRNIEENDLNTYHLARANYYCQEFEEALRHLNELEVQDVDAQNLLALTMYELGQYEGAIEVYKKILEKFHENLNIMLSLAKCYIKINNKEEALKTITTTLSQFPEHEEALKLRSEAEKL